MEGEVKKKKWQKHEQMRAGFCDRWYSMKRIQDQKSHDLTIDQLD